jgi:outer membrane receptor for ferrienterochelin and colicin
MIVVLLLCAQALFAGSTGKITGTITDAKTKEALVGVNVSLVGTSMGAVTNIDGEYTIINVSPNTYTIKASMLGYNTASFTGVKVSIDLTTRQDFQLGETVMEQKEVVITAERPLVQKDMTASTAIVGEELISNLAVTEVKDIVQLQAGITVSQGGDLHLRGGRKGQIAYQIDGVAVTDAYDGSNTIDVGSNVIQELQVVSGAFNAEYGQAMSGVVNIVTKDGDNTIGGSVQVYAGSYVTGRGDIFMNMDNVRPTDIKSVEASLSGPVLEDKLFFFATGRYFKSEGYLYGRRVFLPTDIAIEDPNNTSNWLVFQNGDSSVVSMNPNERAYLQGKLSYRLLSNLKTTYNYIYDYQKYKDYDHNNRLTPDNNVQRFRKTHSNILTFNHAVNASSFYNLSLSYLYKDYKSYLYEDMYTGDPAEPTMYVDNIIRRTPPFSFAIGGTNANRFMRYTKTYAAKLDWVSQATKEISLQFGGEVKQHEFFYQNINLIAMTGANGQQVFPYNVMVAPRTTSDYDQYKFKPREYSAYIQSKFEAFNLNFNAGIRFDAFDSDGRVLDSASYNDPNILSPIKPWNQALTPEQRQARWYKDATVKYKLSPRLGLAFPISAGGVVHFSYGHFFQLPGYEYLYTNAGFKLGDGSGNQGLFGNADLKPQQTVKGEIGLKQQIGEDIVGDVTMFFEDFRDLTGTATDEILLFNNATTYTQYANSDFGNSKGVVMKLEKRFGGGLSASLDYTYSVTKGNSSNPADSRNAILGGGLPETFIAPLDWDQTHTVNLIVNYTRPKDFGFSMIANFYSGQPYTPAVNKNSAVKKNTFPRNSAYKPSIFNIDLRANKDVAIGRMTLTFFVRVFNLFDLDNARNVYSNSGDPVFSFDYLDAKNINPRLYYNSLEELYNNPSFYSEPRRIEIGTSLSF